MEESEPRANESLDIITAALAIAEMSARDRQLERAKRFLSRAQIAIEEIEASPE